jgi:hypothetical protein
VGYPPKLSRRRRAASENDAENDECPEEPRGDTDVKNILVAFDRSTRVGRQCVANLRVAGEEITDAMLAPAARARVEESRECDTR